jgi:predicted transcriptional regulator of viral defense system
MRSWSLSRYIDGLQSDGRFTFTIDELRKEASDRSESATKAALFRIVKKGLIAPVRKGFYTIVPPEYRARGSIPPVLYIDDLMRHLGRDYYVSLLSAAAQHGAGHQQPQEFFVTSGIPALRNISSHGAKIRFLSKRRFLKDGVDEKKTDTGIVKVSSPELTVIDAVLFERSIGGLNRAADVIVELIELINPEKLCVLAVKVCPTTVVQRLGFLLDVVIKNHKLADQLFKAFQKQQLFPVTLCPGKRPSGKSWKNRWKVNENISVKIDL